MSQNDQNKPATRDNTEPTAGFATVPIWLVVVFGGLFYGCQLFLSEHAGGYNELVYAPFHTYEEVTAANPKSAGDEMRLLGQDVFNKTCAACHQPSGLGKEGVAPPLAGSEWVLEGDPARIAHAVLNGLSGPVTVKDKEYNLAMPPWRDVYDDKHLAAVLTYIRSEWGNKARAVKPEEIAAARKDVHPGPMTAPELLAIPVH